VIRLCHDGRTDGYGTSVLVSGKILGDTGGGAEITLGLFGIDEKKGASYRDTFVCLARRLLGSSQPPLASFFIFSDSQRRSPSTSGLCTGNALSLSARALHFVELGSQSTSFFAWMAKQCSRRLVRVVRKSESDGYCC